MALLSKKEQNKAYDKYLYDRSFKFAVAEVGLDTRRNVPFWRKRQVKRKAKAIRKRWLNQGFVDPQPIRQYK
jgi:hypothetical protein